MATKSKKLGGIGTYILDGKGNPVVERDMERWSDWFGQARNRVLKLDKVGRGALVSTVFLGIDPSFHRGAAPLLWETMIFGGDRDQYCQRYATRDEALTGHANAVKLAKARPNRR
jgi:hypothetical protein